MTALSLPAARLRFGGYFPPFPIHAGARHLEKTEQLLGRSIEICMWYQWWDTGWPLPKRARNFQKSWLEAASGREILIKWEPWKPGRQIVQPRFSLDSIVAGDHDVYVRHWATEIRDSQAAVSLCPLPEPNGFWNAWSCEVGKHEPKLYVDAWHHIHGIFRQVGAHNVRWVWNPNAGDAPETNRMEGYYPGPEYVDILGLSVYNWGNVKSWSRWQSFADIIQPYYERISQLGSQPIWVAEMGCAPTGGDRKEWLEKMLEYLPRLSRLEALVWFDAKKETDWRITTDPALRTVFQSLVNN